MQKILFYEDTHYLFSNFSAHAVEYKDIVYPTGEHAYQCQKFIDSHITTEIRDARSPLLAKMVSKRYNDKQVSYWEDIKVQAMYEIVSAKCMQHKEVQDILL